MLYGTRAALQSARLLWLVAVAILCSAVLPARAQTSFVYFSTDLGTVPYDQALAVLAFQGLVNRDAPRLYVNTETLHPDYAQSGPYYSGNQTDPIWLDIYGQRGYSYESVTSVAELLGRQDFRSFVSGLVIYNPDKLPASTWIAMTIAGIENRLPVTPAVLTAIPQLKSWWPDTLDLRSSLTEKLSAYQWAIDQYLPQTSESVAYVIGHDFEGGDPGDFMAVDYAVASRAFVFDLSVDRDSYASDAGLADVIMQHLQPPAAVWGFYSEYIWVDYTSSHGDYAVLGAMASNMSFHRGIAPASTWPLQQTSRSDLLGLALDPNTYYLATVFTDGDIPQRLTRFFEAGNWFDPARGQVPMNWSIDPALAQEFPALFEYFYSTATPNDYFIAGPSGAGYTHPSVMPNQAEYAALVAQCNALTDTDIAVMLDFDLSAAVWDPFLAISGTQAAVQGIVDIQDLFFRGDHVPFFPMTFAWCWWDAQASPDQISADIVARMTQGPPPNFAILYDGQAQKPTIAKQVMDMLAPQGYQLLRLDEMSALARQIDHFFDVGTKYWAHDQVEACFNAGIVTGYSPTHYRPTLPVTRDQMAVYIARALAGGDGNVPAGPVQASFGDVPTNHWAYKYIEYAVSHAVVQGYDPTHYVPDAVVDRGQMAVFVARSQGWVNLGDDMTTAPQVFPDVPAGFWAGTAVKACVDHAVVQGYLDGLYHPSDPVTRDQMAVYIARAFQLPL